MQGCAVASPIGLLYLTLSRQLQYEAFGVSTASLAYPQSVPAIAPCVPPLRVFLRHLYVECIEPWPYIWRLICGGDEGEKISPYHCAGASTLLIGEYMDLIQIS